jgi:purine-cytosine permease-like protein
VAVAEQVSLESLPEEDLAFHIEQRGIDYIPEAERWARPRDIGALWAGASVNVEYFIYGAILMGFGFSFVQTLSLIIIGNLTFFLLGLCSLQGPNTGTTVFGINRASFGPNGSRVMAFFNWITQLGFETEGLILIVGVALVLATKAGFHPGSPAKVLFILLAVAIQVFLPFFGHATMVRVLRLLIVPFIVVYAIVLGFASGHAHLGHPPADYVNWQLYTVGLAFTIALSGLGWTECGNDYSRYLPPSASKRATVGWVFVATALPEIVIMTLGAVVFTAVGTAAQWNGSNPFQALVGQSVVPAWFVVVFLLIAAVQLFGINSLDLYSSGVTLQAIGVRLRRYQAVLLDSVICMGITFWAIFNSQFSTYLRDFVGVVIVWIAPWCAIFLTDWVLRRYRYVPSELQDTSRRSLYYRDGGWNWRALVAQAIGMVAAFSALSPTFHVPSWMNPVTVHTGGADFSVFMGMGVAALAYLVLAGRPVRRQADRQDELLRAEGRLAPA